MFNNITPYYVIIYILILLYSVIGIISMFRTMNKEKIRTNKSNESMSEMTQILSVVPISPRFLANVMLALFIFINVPYIILIFINDLPIYIRLLSACIAFLEIIDAIRRMNAWVNSVDDNNKDFKMFEEVPIKKKIKQYPIFVMNMIISVYIVQILFF
ncbi:hypothetical protein ABQD56_13170 [Vagococcus fluvialis]|uniref:hypothetical protein n=1 Tax=Vagococcus fluvialis TaxID=2738 RepID=UPI0032E39E34